MHDTGYEMQVLFRATHVLTAPSRNKNEHVIPDQFLTAANLGIVSLRA
jgi:hypothetical protein